jgi:transcriptional regulator with PAS, ATPase and Fis domain
MTGRHPYPEDEAGRRVGRAEGDQHGYLDAVRAFSDGNFPAASRRFQALLSTQRRTPKLLIACGHACLHDHDSARAIAFYREAEEVGSLPPEVTYNLALLSLNAGEADEAATLFRQTLDASVSFAAGQFYLGLFFEGSGAFLCDAALYLARIQRDAGRLPESRATYNEALSHDPRSVTALQSLGELFLLSRNYIEAIRHLERILQSSSLEEDLVNAHNNLAIAHYENGATEPAIEHLKWVLKHSPANPTAIHNLNFIYEKEGILRSAASAGALRIIDGGEEGGIPIFQLSAEGEQGIVGRSAEMMRVMRHARVASASDAPVLIRGESGSGKQLLGRLIAMNSARREAPFILLACNGMPDVQLESELFGYEKGAFTGARARKAGALELAAGGTLFLDEVGSLSAILQGKLYRALAERRVAPLGGSQSTPIDVRIIAATSRDLPELIRANSFRQDLYYLLNVVAIEVPPLRERAEDIPLLIDHFLKKHARGKAPMRLPKEDLRVLSEYDWPGNVRELENLIERAVVIGSQSALFLEEITRLKRLRTGTRRESDPVSPTSYPVTMTLAEIEKRHIHAVLASVENNQRQAAKILGINPSTLWRKLKSYGGE